eukprot:scaffold1086_cov397-Prasinococcus_capsulatus_cf.AAC.15
MAAVHMRVIEQKGRKGMSLLSVNSYRNEYTRTIGCATPTISKGCPPNSDCTTPPIAVLART